MRRRAHRSSKHDVSQENITTSHVASSGSKKKLEDVAFTHVD
jgi:hypothetical protein